MPEWFQSDSAYWTCGTTVFVLGILLLVRGWVGRRAAGRPRCRSCDYDFTGSGLICPECGRHHCSAHDLWRPRRYWKRCLLGLGLTLIGAYVLFWPDIAHRRVGLKERWYEAIIPTTAWIGLVPYLGEDHLLLLDRRLVEPGSDSVCFTGGSGGVGPGGVQVFYEYFEVRSPARLQGIWDWQQQMLARRCVAVLDEDVLQPGSTDPRALTAAANQYARRLHATWWLGATIDRNGDSEPVLVRILGESAESDEARAVAATMLRLAANPNPTTIKALSAGCGENISKLRSAAIKSLCAIGRSDAEIVAALAAIAASPDYEAASMAVRALACLRPVTGEMLSALRAAVHAGVGLNRAAQWAMASLGAEAVPVLVNDLLILSGEEPKSDIEGNVVFTLSEIGEPAVPALVQLLDHPDLRVQERALYTLNLMYHRAKAALPALRERLQRTVDESDRANLEQIIREITEGDPLFPGR